MPSPFLPSKNYFPRSFGVRCHRLVNSGKHRRIGRRQGAPYEVKRGLELEARGVEPLSPKLSTQASTCVAGDNFKEPNFAPAQCQPPSVREIDLTVARGRPALRPACCPRFRRQQASLRKRHGQLSRESEIFVICVYLFWSGFLRGQRTILDMPPALPTTSRSQCAPLFSKSTVRI